MCASRFDAGQEKKRMKIVCDGLELDGEGQWERKRNSDRQAIAVDVVCTNERDRNVLHVSKHLSVRFKFLDYACV